MANKGGLLSNLGQAVSGYASALSGNPLYLQNSLIMRQAQQQQAQQEQAQRQDQVANIATRSLMTGGSEMTPERKMGMLNLMAPQAMRSALAQQAISQIFPQGFTGTLGEGQVALQNGKIVAAVPAKKAESAFKVGHTRDIVRGNALVTEEYQPDGSWKQIGSGPRWEAPQAPQKPFGYDEEQARKAEEAARKQRADEYAFKTTDEGFTDIMRSAAKLGTNPNLAAYTGKFDAMTPNFTGGAQQFQSDLDVLKSNLAMNALNAARAGSATGATGFGALSEGELKILQNQIATLDPAVGPENFQRQVVDIIQKTKKMQGALRATRPTAPSAAPSALPGFKIEPLD